MSKRKPKLEAAIDPKLRGLTQALDQSEQVRDKVEQAGLGLSSVNAVLKDEIPDTRSLPQVEQALEQSGTIELKVQEAAAQLVAVNAALAVEINERHHLEHELADSTAALSESRAQELIAKRSALHDAVTGLSNLTLFNDRLSNALAQAKRHQWQLAVMFIDLDDFKSINDSHGHLIGDRVLQTIAQRLQTMVRSSDTLSRRSGDEFLFLMLEAKDNANAAAFAARIAAKIGEPCELDGLTVTISASVGFAMFPTDGQAPEELLQHADAAMYKVKQLHHRTTPPTRSTS